MRRTVLCLLAAACGGDGGDTYALSWDGPLLRAEQWPMPPCLRINGERDGGEWIVVRSVTFLGSGDDLTILAYKPDGHAAMTEDGDPLRYWSFPSITWFHGADQSGTLVVGHLHFRLGVPAASVQRCDEAYCSVGSRWVMTGRPLADGCE